MSEANNPTASTREPPAPTQNTTRYPNPRTVCNVFPNPIPAIRFRNEHTYTANAFSRSATAVLLPGHTRPINADREIVVRYTYDRDGRRLTMTRPAVFSNVGPFGTTSYGYDPQTGALSWSR